MGTFCFLLSSEKKRYNQRGKKKCLMVERTLLTKESHGSLASSQRSHERCCHSPQHSLNHVLPATPPATSHLAPRGQQLSSAKPCSAVPLGGWLAPVEGGSSVRNYARDFGKWRFPPAPSGHGGEVGDSDAMFQMRRNHAVSSACGRKRVTESNDVALTPRFPFSKCCGSFRFPAPPLPPSRASVVIALLKLWETEAGRSQDTAIQHLRHRSSLWPCLSSPQSKSHHGEAYSLEGLSCCPGQGPDQLEMHLGFFRCFLALLLGTLGPVLVPHVHTALLGAT